MHRSLMPITPEFFSFWFSLPYAVEPGMAWLGVFRFGRLVEFKRLGSRGHVVLKMRTCTIQRSCMWV